MKAPAELPPLLRAAVHDRSGGMCEAYLMLGDTVHTRCWVSPTEVHHALPRSRGGRWLDKAGETHHLVDLCHHHHREAEKERPDAYQKGLLISGYVTWDALLQRPVYTGPDTYLTKTYGDPHGTS